MFFEWKCILSKRDGKTNFITKNKLKLSAIYCELKQFVLQLIYDQNQILWSTRSSAGSISNPSNVSDYYIEFDDSRLKFANGERYMLWESTGSFPTATLQLYGDSAEPQVPDNFTPTLVFEVTDDGSTKDPVNR